MEVQKWDVHLQVITQDENGVDQVTYGGWVTIAEKADNGPLLGLNDEDDLSIWVDMVGLLEADRFYRCKFTINAHEVNDFGMTGNLAATYIMLGELFVGEECPGNSDDPPVYQR